MEQRTRTKEPFDALRRIVEGERWRILPPTAPTVCDDADCGRVWRDREPAAPPVRKVRSTQLGDQRQELRPGPADPAD
jgi:hypothetical protein